MNIGVHNLSQNEEACILNIYHQFKQAFSACELVNTKTIIKIGEPNRQAMCRFMYVKSKIFAKFKYIDEKVDIFDASIHGKITATIELFKQKHLSYKNPLYKSKVYISKNSPYANLAPHIVIKEFERLVANLDDKYDAITFDHCSTRLRNILYQNNIRNLQILKLYSLEYFLHLRYLGQKSLWELCEFLTKVTNGKVRVPKRAGSPAPIENADNPLDKQYNMLIYINKVNSKQPICDLNGAFKLYTQNIDKYSLLYVEFMEYLSKLSLCKLAPREQAIFNSRFGINEAPKTLQEIGNIHSRTRERIRQIVVQITNTMKNRKLTNVDAVIELEYYKCQLFERIEQVSFEGFLTYVFFEYNNNIEQLKFLYLLLFNQPMDFLFFKGELEKQCWRYKQELVNAERAKIYNENFYNLIKFKNPKTVTDAWYSKLKTEREVCTCEPTLHAFVYDGIAYQCESFLERKILVKLLSCKTFKQIKTQSLKIPFNNSHYYPDFQCLTHDNHLVIIEVKPLLNMCVSYNIQKFYTLKDYCEKHGYGYLILDDKRNSFFDINDPNEKFNSALLAELNQNPNIKYDEYKEIYSGTHASLKNLLTLIKDKKLTLTFPFKLTN